jgi:hypothetical protein
VILEIGIAIGIEIETCREKLDRENGTTCAKASAERPVRIGALR